MTEEKLVYLFEEGNAQMKELLGGKGANLAEMTRIGLPVPPGFTISTGACRTFFEEDKAIPQSLQEEWAAALKTLEGALGKEFGSPENPLLVSVRSGAVHSMPGMMDTILNLGLNDKTLEGLAASSGNRAFALDCYRRFIQMFSDVVLHIDHFYFEEALTAQKMEAGVQQDPDLSEADLEKLITAYKGIVKNHTRKGFPQEPLEQLELAVKAVFDSWDNQRARVYRRLNRIPDHLGTAVNVQAMVFGNMGEDSGTGVAFTRNPSTGEKKIYGEFLINAQGEDVVAGIRTPLPIERMGEKMPGVHKEFLDVCALLEKHYRDMQDIEFTVEKGKLFLLQTRTGKRTTAAAVKAAVDMESEGLIDREEAVMRVDASQIDQLLHSQIDPGAKLKVIATGLPASPGAASGKIVFDADKAEEMAETGEKVLLVRTETTPDDIHGIVAAQGVLTTRGGMTSHAAVVARGMGKPCVCGCEAVEIDGALGIMEVEGLTLKEGELLSIDGSTGRVIRGQVPLIPPRLSSEFQHFLSWADEYRDMGVRANADTPEDAAKAREFGAQGIGLCRTEHMFMAQERLPVVQEMILAGDKKERDRALARLLPMQQQDFKEIFRAMASLPVTIRLLDPPLHEFLPNLEKLVIERTRLKCSGAPEKEIYEKDKLIKQIRSLSEANPMLGHRGCRLGILFPEIYEMQVDAIFHAVAELQDEGIQVTPEIMIPLVGTSRELEILRQMVEERALAISREQGREFHYLVGTMIELPRACVTAGSIAAHADFFSFGTNDLTQTTFGYSRDDAESKFLHHYINSKIIPENPFAVLDREGVGDLVKTGVDRGRREKPGLKMGICGEHGGDPSSIDFCQQVGLNYVSCSPFRVPVARLAAAQAALRMKKAGKG